MAVRNIDKVKTLKEKEQNAKKSMKDYKLSIIDGIVSTIKNNQDFIDAIDTFLALPKEAKEAITTNGLECYNGYIGSVALYEKELTHSKNCTSKFTVALDNKGKLSFGFHKVTFIENWLFSSSVPGHCLDVDNPEKMYFYDQQVQMLIEFREKLNEFAKNVFNFVNSL